MHESSGTSYVNDDVIEEMGLNGTKEKVITNVANGQTASLMLATMEVGLDSLDGQVETIIVAKTSNIICGGRKPTNWPANQKHVRHITFPKLGERSKIDVLIGSDYYNLRLVEATINLASARLCPLGWTAIGTIVTSEDMEQVTLVA